MRSILILNLSRKSFRSGTPIPTVPQSQCFCLTSTSGLGGISNYRTDDENPDIILGRNQNSAKIRRSMGDHDPKAAGTYTSAAGNSVGVAIMLKRAQDSVARWAFCRRS